VNLDDIKSPLPPRRSNWDTKETTTAPLAAANPTPVVENTTVSSNALPLTDNNQAKKKINFAKYLPILGIVIVVPLIILVVSKLLLPAIGGKASKEVTLIYWGMWEDSAVLRSIFDEFEANNPGVTINYVQNQSTNYRTRLSGRLAKSGEEDVPDLFRIHSSWMPMFKQYLAQVPNTTVTQIQLETDYYEAYKKDLKQGNSFYGVPLMYDQLALFYNKDIFESAQKSPPRTWWGLRETAKELTVRDEAGRIKVAGVGMGTVENVDHYSDILGLMMKQNNVDLYAGDAANKTKLEAILTFYSLFKTQDKVWDESLAQSTVQFANGKLAMYFGPSWRVFNLNDMNSSLRFEVTGVPQLPTVDGLPESKVESGEIDGQLTNDQWSTYWFEGVNNKSANQDMAWKLLAFMSEKENLEKFYTAASQIRAFGEIYPRKSMAESVTANAKAKYFVLGADNGGSWYLSSRTFDEGLNDDMSKYFGDAINSLLNNTGQDVGVLITPLQNGINQQVTKYKLTRKLSE